MQAGTSNKVLIPLTFSSAINLPNVTVGSLHLEPPDLYKSINNMSILLKSLHGFNLLYLTLFLFLLNFSLLYITPFSFLYIFSSFIIYEILT